MKHLVKRKRKACRKRKRLAGKLCETLKAGVYDRRGIACASILRYGGNSMQNGNLSRSFPLLCYLPADAAAAGVYLGNRCHQAVFHLCGNLTGHKNGAAKF